MVAVTPRSPRRGTDRGSAPPARPPWSGARRAMRRVHRHGAVVPARGLRGGPRALPEGGPSRPNRRSAPPRQRCAAAADPDGWRRVGRRRHRRRREVIVLAVVLEAAVPPEPLDHVEHLVHPRAACPRVMPEERDLLLQPAHSASKREPAATEGRDRAGLFRDGERVAHGQDVHVRHEPKGGRSRRHGSDRGERIGMVDAGRERISHTGMRRHEVAGTATWSGSAIPVKPNCSAARAMSTYCRTSRSKIRGSQNSTALRASLHPESTALELDGDDELLRDRSGIRLVRDALAKAALRAPDRSPAARRPPSTRRAPASSPPPRARAGR